MFINITHIIQSAPQTFFSYGIFCEGSRHKRSNLLSKTAYSLIVTPVAASKFLNKYAAYWKNIIFININFNLDLIFNCFQFLINFYFQLKCNRN